MHEPLPLRDRRKLGHQRLTSTSRTSTVSGIWLAALASRQPTIASRMLAMASCSVLPWEIHPGMEGHSTTKVPVSSRSRVTSNFIEKNFTCESSVRQLSLSNSAGKMIPDTEEEQKAMAKVHLARQGEKHRGSTVSAA